MPAPRHFTHYWSNPTWQAYRATATEGELLDHTASNVFLERGIQAGDFIYVVTVLLGALHVLTELRVAFLSDQDTATAAMSEQERVTCISHNGCAYCAVCAASRLCENPDTHPQRCIHHLILEASVRLVMSVLSMAIQIFSINLWMGLADRIPLTRLRQRRILSLGKHAILLLTTKREYRVPVDLSPQEQYQAE